MAKMTRTQLAIMFDRLLNLLEDDEEDAEVPWPGRFPIEARTKRAVEIIKECAGGYYSACDPDPKSVSHGPECEKATAMDTQACLNDAIDHVGYFRKRVNIEAERVAYWLEEDSRRGSKNGST